MSIVKLIKTKNHGSLFKAIIQNIPMITIPNNRKLPSSIVFLNLSSLFTTYCSTNTEIDYPLHYLNQDDVISILHKNDKVLDIQVTDTNIKITPVTRTAHLYEASEKFIHALTA